MLWMTYRSTHILHDAHTLDIVHYKLRRHTGHSTRFAQCRMHYSRHMPNSLYSSSVLGDMLRTMWCATSLRRYVLRACAIVVHTCGAWSQGPLTHEALGILQHADLESMGYGSETYFHTVAEALKLTLADREAYLGDPDFVDVPLERTKRKVDLDEMQIDADKVPQLVVKLRKEMRNAAAKLEFERAAELRDQVRDLEAWLLDPTSA